jgi:hypothetical protein
MAASMTLVEVYEQYAKDCLEAADRTNNPVYRGDAVQDGPGVAAGRGRGGRAASIEAIDVAEHGRSGSF